jgi:hypothetical protein
MVWFWKIPHQVPSGEKNKKVLGSHRLPPLEDALRIFETDIRTGATIVRKDYNLGCCERSSQVPGWHALNTKRCKRDTKLNSVVTYLTQT